MMRRFIHITVLLGAFAASAFGQGCAQCAANASSTTEGAQSGLRKGILILLVPSVGLMIGLLQLARKYRPAAED